MANRPISTNGETRAEYLSEELTRLQHVQTSWALRTGMGITAGNYVAKVTASK